MTKEQHPTVLLVENDLTTAQLYKGYLENEPRNVLHVDTGEAALRHLQQATPAAILLDFGLPDMSGMAILKSVYEQKINCAVIVITMENTVNFVVEAMRYGISHFLEKPVQAEQFIATLRQALRGKNNSYPVDFNTIYPPKTRQQYHQFIGGSAPIQTVYQMIGHVAASQAPILITGENGTGKELCADALHKESKRAAQPFIVFDCAAVPKELMESQLFGHVKGAFTSAISDRQGAASQADGGTLFLDEIGEMPLELQSTLLRFMQTKTFHKVGSDKLERVDVRFICATNRDLAAEIKAKRFREDLYFRINVAHIQLPALRIRGNDILLLAQTFLSHLAKLEEKPCRGFSADVQEILLDYHWPGNVRQLENVIYCALLTTDENEMITGERLRTTIYDKHACEPYTLTRELSSAAQEPPPQQQPLSVAIKSGNTLRSFEEIKTDVLLKALEACHGNVEKTAKSLKIGPATIHRHKQKWKANGYNPSFF
ncbi:MAG: sigma-54 dependent transcriptional regulator [Candidatus Parabeggiatoa sp.]|nr:sigma-54 dependent transcriptional regulator [Candidatus Parabeggiatoa sp.]